MRCEVVGHWCLLFMQKTIRERRLDLRASTLIRVFADGIHTRPSLIPKSRGRSFPHPLIPPSHTCRFSSAYFFGNFVDFIHRILNFGSLLLEIVGVCAETGEMRQR